MAERQSAELIGKPATEPDESVLTIVRVFNAPRALVFKMWTDPAHYVRWTGPRDYPAFSVESDPKPGGKWRIGLRSAANGFELWQSGEYREVIAPQRLSFTFTWDVEPGTDIPGSETLVTITFEEVDGKTTMTFRQGPFVRISARDGHGKGWNSAFDRCVDYLKELAAG